MRKALVLLVAIAIGAVTVPASASTLVAPFFNDAGTLLNPFNTGVTTPALPAGTGLRGTILDGALDRTWGIEGQSTYIALSNIGTATAVVAVTYTDMFGVDGTPVNNTFELGAKQSIIGRPVRFDSFMETTTGADLGTGTFGTPVMPKAVQTGTGFLVKDHGGGANGGAVFETATEDAALAGAIRVFSWGPQGQANVSTEQAPLFRP